MNEKYDEAMALVLSLTLEDVIEKNKLLPFSQAIQKFSDLTREYRNSEYIKQEWKAMKTRYDKALATKRDREKRRAEWCAKNLKVGDWVKVTGTSTAKYRKITALNGTTFDNLQGNPLENKTRNVATTTSYSRVTEVLNPATRIMEKIAV